jgi:UDP-glucuronate decarboxylase
LCGRCWATTSIYGEGTQARSFCYVDDLIEAIVRMMETPSGVTGPINIGNPHEFTIREVAELIIKLTGTKSKLRFEPLPSDDPRQRQPDISQAKLTLKWEPKTQLREGLTKTVAYFENILRKDVSTPMRASSFVPVRV